VRDSQVYLNGELLNQSFLPPEYVTNAGEFNQEGVERIVPEGQYLAFGDNREHSRDGREFGPVPKDSIVGKAFFVYWPPQEVGLVPTVRF
jgi:signal peptidase I